MDTRAAELACSDANRAKWGSFLDSELHSLSPGETRVSPEIRRTRAASGAAPGASGAACSAACAA
jgi:hypothetical protein